MQRLLLKAKLLWLGFIFLTSVVIFSLDQSPAAAQDNLPKEGTVARTTRVIVQLDIPYETEGRITQRSLVNQQRASIRLAQDNLVRRLSGSGEVRTIAAYQFIPYIALEIDTDLLEMLEADEEVLSIQPDEAVPLNLISSLPVIGVPVAHEAGISGQGQTVAVLDTGVDIEHEAFTTGGNRIVAEACFSSTSVSLGGSFSVCPDGNDESYASGAGDDCVDEAINVGVSGATSDCKHGSHVAGIIGASSDALTGVAPDVQIIAVQVFSAFEDYGRMLSFTSDQIQGLEYVYSLRDTYDIAAVNMSLGAGNYSGACDADARATMIETLKAAGIATVIAAGNEGNTGGIGSPACVTDAISVGASEDDDDIASFSNVSSELDLVAPGSSIESSVPGGSATYSGTSMAAPMVAGTFALLSEINPSGSVDDHLTLLRSTAEVVDDSRPNGVLTGFRRIDVAAAVNGLSSGVSLELSGPTETYTNWELPLTATLSNNSINAIDGLQLDHTLPTSATLVAGTVTSGGMLADDILSWRNLTLAPFETVTYTWHLQPQAAQAMLAQVDVSGSALGETVSATHAVDVLPTPVCNLFDGFDGGQYRSEWQTDTLSSGQLTVMDQVGRSNGYAMLLDDLTLDGSDGSSFLTLPVDLSGAQPVWLDFWWRGKGSANSGLFLSWDLGESWAQYQSPATTAAYERVLIDLSTLTPTSGNWTNAYPLMIRFGYQGDGPFDPNASHTDMRGLMLDEVQINCGTDLVWDGGAGHPDWSDPRNWSPDLEPRGNHVTFNGTSSASSAVDSGFNGSIDSLLVDIGYTGTLTQSAGLTVSGPFTQTAGTIQFSALNQMTVDGSFSFQDGIMRQSKTVNGNTQTFLRFTDQYSTTLKHDGVSLSDRDDAGTVTVTFAGPSFGLDACEGLNELSVAGLTRCVDLELETAEVPTMRLYLNPSELEMANGGSGVSPIASVNGDVLVPEINELGLLQYRNGAWEPLVGFGTGQDGTGIYIEGEVDGLHPIAAIGSVDVPTAITLSLFSIQTPSFIAQISASTRDLLIFLLLLFVTTLHRRIRSSIITSLCKMITSGGCFAPIWRRFYRQS